MSNTRPTHHSLNGEELRQIIEQRVHQGILQSMNLRSMYAFPLVRYKVTIEVMPYIHQGQAAPVEDTKHKDKCIVEGEEFVFVEPEAVELVHESPLIGYESDPQKEREELGLGRMETRRIEGQFVDVHVGAKVKIEEPELPLRGRTTPQPMPPRATAIKVSPVKKSTPVDVSAGMKPATEAPAISVDNPAGLPQQEVEQIAKKEAESWQAPAPDPLFTDSMRNEEPLPGRVTVVGKDGPQRG